MTKYEILEMEVPTEPHHFESDREEQWYKLGLYEGAISSPWNELKKDGPKMPKDADILLRFEDGSIRRYEEELPELLVTHWMEIQKV